jgi:signal transduction histidine kinase
MNDGKNSDKLTIATKKIAFLNQEKQNQANELKAAYKEIAIQIEERGTRAAELAIANIELTFQNQEKQKRAAELAIANLELVFQNQEKEKRAAELAIANLELVFQNEEKEKRAAELTVANLELVFQNEEKEKRAAELALANIELQNAEAAVRLLNAELEQKVKIRSAQYAFISQVNQTIVHVKDAETLFRNSCRIAIDFGLFKMAWIGSFDTEQNKIILLKYSGISSEDIKPFANPKYEDNSPQDVVLRTGKYFLCNDIEHSLELESWKPYAAGHNIRSCIVLPIKKLGSVFGTFNLFATEQDFFDHDNIKLAVQVTADISFALDLFEKAKRHDEAEENLAQSEAKLKEAQALSHTSNWELDLVTHVNKWSDEFFKICGISRHEIEPSPEAFFSMLDHGDYELAKESVEQKFQKFEAGSFSSRIKNRSGSVRHIYIEWKFDFDKSMKPCRLYGILQDVTERRIAEEEREKLINDTVRRNRDLQQFTFIISHNLRAPAANIIAVAELLQNETLTPTEKQEFLKGLSTSVAALDTVIKDINAILQVKQEVGERKELIHFSTLVHDITGSIRNLLDKHKVLIKTDFSEIDEMFSLKVYLHSIFYNLITNSIKYSKPNEQPLIEIKSRKDNGKIILTFKDNGLGIDIKTKGDKVFGLYSRFHFHVEGKGMGLFMVKTQIEAIGGKITVTSELNKGTEFTIVFDTETR